MRFVTATILLLAAIGVHVWNARGGNAVGFAFFRALAPEAVSYTHLTLPTNREV